jgi:hypothetical protein
MTSRQGPRSQMPWVGETAVSTSIRLVTRPIMLRETASDPMIGRVRSGAILGRRFRGCRSPIRPGGRFGFANPVPTGSGDPLLGRQSLLSEGRGGNAGSASAAPAGPEHGLGTGRALGSGAQGRLGRAGLAWSCVQPETAADNPTKGTQSPALFCSDVPLPSG